MNDKPKCEVEAIVCVDVSPQLLAHPTDRFRTIECEIVWKLSHETKQTSIERSNRKIVRTRCPPEVRWMKRRNQLLLESGVRC